jgi:predicted MFS family arabinose efflux permease
MWAGALAALLFALNRGNPWGWTSPAVLVTLLISAILLTGFLWVEPPKQSAMVQLLLIRRSAFSLTLAALTLSYMSGYLLIFLLPFYLAQGRHMPTASIGLLLAAYGLIRAVVAPLAGRVSDRMGAPLPATCGAALFALGLFLLSRLTLEASLGWVIICVLIAGAGIGIFVPPNNSMLLGAASRSQQGVAAGILATSRTLGMGMGVALAGVNTVNSGFTLASVIALFTLTICVAGLRMTSPSQSKSPTMSR